MIENKVFIDRARYLQKPVPSDASIEAALSNYDEAAITQSWRERVTISVWDGVSNINAATPAYILESNPWVNKVYMLLIDEKIVYMQTHEPYVEGYVPITPSSVGPVSASHADNIASELARNEIIQAVLADLNLLD